MAKTKKKQLSDFNQRRKNERAKKSLNPFEIHINKDKQNVLGRKSKVDYGLPGVSRAKAIKKRKGTLLQEFKTKHKDNVFLDKRIGEKNFSMSEEDKAMARFAAERIKSHKKQSIYNLNDEEQLTHRGQTLEEIEKFDDPRSDDEDSDGGNRTGRLGDKFVDEAHFGGGILSKSDTGKSRKDLIEQLIVESKKRKAEKQKIREQTMDLTEKLDTEWKDLLPIVSAANKALEDPVDTRRADAYDMAVRQLKFEPRGTPSDKLRSEEDIVREEKERLEALENDRLARMKGFVSDNNNVIKHKSADDLDDGFLKVTIRSDVDEADKSEEKEDAEHSTDSENEDNEKDDNDDSQNIKDGDDNEENKNTSDADDDAEENEEDDAEDDAEEAEIKDSDDKSLDNTAAEDSNAEDSEAEGSDEDALSDLKASDSSSEDESSSPKKTVKFGTIDQQKPKAKTSQVVSILKKHDSPEKSTGVDRQNEIREDLQKRKEIMEKARKELPYTYSVPESYEELEKLLENQNPEYQSVIMDRIIKCNHWSLNGANKEKLSTLFSFLLQYIDTTASQADSESIVDCFKIIDRLTPYLYDLAHVNAESTRASVQELIKEKHESFEINKKLYPDLGTLIIFKLVSLLFPTSDFRHPVVTPCLIFMSQILLRCHVKSRIDISKGLFICTLMLEYTSLSKRFSPATINYLRGIIHLATPKHLVQGFKVIPPFKNTGDFCNLLVLDKQVKNLKINPENACMKAPDLVSEEFDDDFKLRVLLVAVNMLKEFKTNFEEIEARASIFSPILKLLNLNTLKRYSETCQTHIKEFETSLEELKEKKLEYIMRQKKKPKTLRMYEPRIERVYDGKRHKPMSKEKAEREKLLHKYKKEMKGAVREIRKDRAFLAKVQIKEQIKSDTERKRKVKEIFGDAAVQQSELKKMKRKK